MPMKRPAAYSGVRGPSFRDIVKKLITFDKGKEMSKTTNLEFPLGAELRDKVTHFTGFAVARTLFVNGCVQYGLQARGEDNAKPSTQHIDYQRLEETGNVLSGLSLIGFDKKFELGIKVRDTLSGLQGILVLHTITLSGQQEYAVQPAVLDGAKAEKMPDFFHVYPEWIEVIEPEPVKMPSSDTGGPAYKPGGRSMIG